jgi:hypothetical protein
MNDDDKVVRFPRQAHSAEADVLSALQAALSDAETKDDPGKEVREVRQSIKGNGNVQVGGDVHFYADPFPARGDFIECPACREPVGRYADLCLHCGNNVSRHLAQLHQSRVQRRAIFMGLACMSIFGTSLTLLQFDFVPMSWHFPLGAVAVITGFLGLMCAQAM